VKYEYEVWYHEHKDQDEPFALRAGTRRREAEKMAREVAAMPQTHAVLLMRRQQDWEVVYRPANKRGSAG
jgi:hypothetical protein